MPKITASSIEEHNLQTRKRLFVALKTLMADNGFDSITMSQIATEAQMGRTAIYNHFRDKECLLIGMVLAETKTHVEKVSKALAAVEDPVKRLWVFIKVQIEMDPLLYFPPGPGLRSIVSPSALAQIRECEGSIIALLHDIVTELQRANLIAVENIDHVIPLVNACVFVASSAEREQQSAALAASHEFILRGLGFSPAAAVDER